jgi:glycosyltransferase involved in cell wall biosynthesis
MPHAGSEELGYSPFVTVAIPTFNRASWLCDCVQTALSQSYPHFEVLVSDNASTDETANVLSQFSQARLRVVRQPSNIGLIPNWNACLAEARGDYILFLSDDDRINPYFLDRCIALIRLEPQLPIVVALVELYGEEDQRRVSAAASRKLQTGIWDGIDVLDEYLQGRITTQMCTILLRTHELRALGGFPNEMVYAADLVLVASALLKGRAGLINECCGSYHVHKMSWTSRVGVDLRLQETRQLVNIIAERVAACGHSQQKSRDIGIHARKYYLLIVAYVLIEYCWAGKSFAEILSVLWRWRSDLMPAATMYLRRQSKRLAAYLLPEPILRQLRQLGQQSTR